MKRFLNFIFTIVFVCLSFSCKVYAENKNKIVDNAGLLATQDIETFSEQMNQLIEKYKCDIVFVSVNSLENKTVEAYANDYYDYNDYGVGGKKTGILFLISMKERQIHISTKGNAIRIFSNKRIKNIISTLSNNAKKENYNAAIKSYLHDVERYINESKNEKVKNIVMIIVGAFVLSFFILILIKKKSQVRKNNYARGYIKEDSFKLRNQKDIFLYSHISRRRRVESSNKSSTHRSSSGSTHGGGSGSF